jgi:two-component system CheB/CheR fusion protein
MVKPVPETGADQRAAVVMFIEGEEVDETDAAAERPVSDETVRRLTQELELTQARLRTMREESDAANQELRAANEELQSINEATARRPRNWKPARRNCSRSTKNCRPSTAS